MHFGTWRKYYILEMVSHKTSFLFHMMLHLPCFLYVFICHALFVFSTSWTNSTTIPMPTAQMTKPKQTNEPNANKHIQIPYDQKSHLNPMDQMLVRWTEARLNRFCKSADNEALFDKNWLSQTISSKGSEDSIQLETQDDWVSHILDIKFFDCVLKEMETMSLHQFKHLQMDMKQQSRKPISNVPKEENRRKRHLPSSLPYLPTANFTTNQKSTSISKMSLYKNTMLRLSNLTVSNPQSSSFYKQTSPPATSPKSFSRLKRATQMEEFDLEKELGSQMSIKASREVFCGAQKHTGETANEQNWSSILRSLTGHVSALTYTYLL